jgi:hypothetical protein
MYCIVSSPYTTNCYSWGGEGLSLTDSEICCIYTNLCIRNAYETEAFSRLFGRRNCCFLARNRYWRASRRLRTRILANSKYCDMLVISWANKYVPNVMNNIIMVSVIQFNSRTRLKFNLSSVNVPIMRVKLINHCPYVTCFSRPSTRNPV